LVGYNLAVKIISEILAGKELIYACYLIDQGNPREKRK
jgi:hypothetical protein